ncbi:hypothetical protein [Halopiger thermotolerans]
MDFAVENYLEESTLIDVAFLYPDESERSEAIAYEDSFEIPPQTELDETWSVEDVVTDRPYRIELIVGSTGVSHHYHYLPDCGDEDPYEIGVLARLLDDGVRFSQTTCSDDSILL